MSSQARACVYCHCAPADEREGAIIICDKCIEKYKLTPIKCALCHGCDWVPIDDPDERYVFCQECDGKICMTCWQNYGMMREDDTYTCPTCMQGAN